MATHKMAGIKELEPPTNITAPHSFLGLGNVFRRLEPNFARMVVPLSNKLKKDQPNRFGDFSAEEMRTV